MAWTTSAGPWASIAHTGEASSLTQQASITLNSLKITRGTLAFGAAILHIAAIALVLPSLPDPGLGALLLASAVVLAAGVWVALEKTASQPLSSGHDEPAQLPFAAPSSGCAGSTAAPVDGLDSGSPIVVMQRLDSPGEHAIAGCAISAYSAMGLRPHARGKTNVHNPEWADLMARVSHELRTPLNAVLGFSDVMDRGLFGPLGHHRYQEYARHIHDSGRDLLKSAEDTLAVTSLLAEPNRHRATDVIELGDLVAEAWAFFGRAPAARGITLEVDCERGIEITCDRRTIRQVLINLLSEAIARSGRGTVVHVDASCCGARVDFDVTLSQHPESTIREAGSLHVCLARTLLEFHGSQLHEFVGADNAWRAATRFDRAVQADFFPA